MTITKFCVMCTIMGIANLVVLLHWIQSGPFIWVFGWVCARAYDLILEILYRYWRLT